jgi:hypothetical protein
MRARPALIILSVVAAGLVAAATPAEANFHFMKVREVFAGTTASADADFVELQMYTSGQDQVQNHNLTLYSATGTPTVFTIPDDVANDQNQSTILIATGAAETQLAFQADFDTMPAALGGAGGAVCFENIDCVSWGTFTGAVLPSAAGTPFPGGIPTDQSIERKITAGCATLLENGDDTNDSANDFQAVPPDPEPNSQPPNETACGGGGGGGVQQGGDPAVTVQGLKTKKPGAKAVITGRIDPPDPGGNVKVTLFAKGSPFTKVGKKKDGLNSESRFKVKIGVPADAKKCKVTVAYRGSIEATKKFKC